MPIQNPNSIQPATFGIDALIPGAEKFVANRKAEARSEEDQAAMDEFAKKMDTMTPVEVGQFVLKNPRVGKNIAAAMDVSRTLTKEENLQQAMAIATAFITGKKTPGTTPTEITPVSPITQPGIGFDQDVIPGQQTPIQPPVGQPVMADQPPVISPELPVNPAQEEAVKVLTDRAELVMSRGGDAKDSIEGIRDTMTGGEKAFKGAMAVIAANDSQAFDRLMKLQYGGEQKSTPATDIDDFVSDAVKVYKADNPNASESDIAKESNRARLQIKRAQKEEAGGVAGARKTAELDVISQMQPGIDRDKAITVYQAGQEEKRNQTAIDNGLIAAESMPNIKRGLDLLKGIETGGFDNAKLAAKRFFGVEGADEGELSNRLAKAVLSQLRTTFGAQFTEGEGQRLIRIEAGFDKSPENNQRLLNQALLMAQGKVDIAVKIAESKGDQSAIDQIKSWTDFDLGAGATSTPEVSTKAEYDALAPGAFYMEDGKKYQKPGGQ